MTITLDDRPQKRLVLNLRGSVIRNADFSNANLEDANFSNADCSGCDFRGSDLKRANFLDANLEGARFDGADVKAANFEGARLDRQALSSFEQISLTQVKSASLPMLLFDQQRFSPEQLLANFPNIKA